MKAFEIVKRLRNLDRFSPWLNEEDSIIHEKDEKGEWVKVEDIENIIKEILNNP